MTDFSATVARDGAGRRVLERDAHGALHSALTWAGDRLAAAALRLADGRWLVIEPGAGAPGPWGRSDRLLLAAGADGADARLLTTMSALDWGAVDRIPVVAEPARLPPGGGTAALNLVAALAADQAREWLAYRGPYPSEALFLSLLESFWYEASADDPLAAFVGGALRWAPAPHERLLVAEGILAQRRGRIEKVQDGARLYHRPDWQGVRRHAPRLVRDDGEQVRCSLAALGETLEDHLVLAADGTLQARLTATPDEPEIIPFPSALVDGVAAAVAASSVPPLRTGIAEAARAAAMAWGPVDRDLADSGGERLLLSHRLRRLLARRFAAAPARRDRLALGFAGVAEIAALAGDVLRARAQQALAAADPATQRHALVDETMPGSDGNETAKRIGAAVEALLAQLLA